MSSIPVIGPVPDVGTAPATSNRLARLVASLRARAGTGLAYALADQVVYSFGNMIVAALISRGCAQRDFGIYILTQRSMDVLIQLSYVFLWGPFTFNLPGTAESGRARYQGSILSLQVIFCGVATLALWAAAHWTSGTAGNLYHGTFAPLVATAAGILFREFTRRMYFAQMRMKEALWTDVATVFLQIVGVEWLYRTGQLNVAKTLGVLCLGSVVVSLWWVAREWRRCTLSLPAVTTDLRLNLRLGRWFLGSNMVFLASLQCNPWVLSGLLGGASVGAYTICESVVNIPRVALNSMHNVMGPLMARAYHKGGRPALFAEVRRLDRLLLAGSSVFALAIWSVGPFVARLIFKTAPGNARVILAILCLNLVAYAATLAHTFGLTSLQRADTTFYANTLGLAVQGGLCLILVRQFQLPGAAAAMLIGNLVVYATRALFYRREERASEAPGLACA